MPKLVALTVGTTVMLPTVRFGDIHIGHRCQVVKQMLSVLYAFNFNLLCIIHIHNSSVQGANLDASELTF